MFEKEMPFVPVFNSRKEMDEIIIIDGKSIRNFDYRWAKYDKEKKEYFDYSKEGINV